MPVNELEEDRMYDADAGRDGAFFGRPLHVPRDHVSRTAGMGSLSAAQLGARKSLPLSLAMKYQRIVRTICTIS